MKTKIFLLCGFLLATSILFAQMKLKTTRQVLFAVENGKPIPFSGQAVLYKYDKFNNSRCAEKWDTVLIGNKIDYINYSIEMSNDYGYLPDTLFTKHYKILKTSEKSFVQWVLTHCAMKNACYNGLKPIGIGIFLSFLEEI